MDPLYEEQIRIEKADVKLGIELYRRKYIKAFTKGEDLTKRFYPEKTLTEKGTAKFYLKLKDNPEWLGEISEYISEIEPENIAYLVSYYCINLISRIDSIQNVYKMIGKSASEELEFSRLKKQHPNYAKNIIRKHESSTTYERKRAIKYACQRKKVKETKWDKRTCLKIGKSLVEKYIKLTGYLVILTVSGREIIRPATTTLDWLEDQHTNCQWMNRPNLAPLLVKPLPWSGWDDGGYHWRF